VKLAVVLDGIVDEFKMDAPELPGSMDFRKNSRL
jgi:hypothetical protein